MSWLLRLYPRAWRARYGDELGGLLAQERLTPRLVFDLLGGALDAHLNPQLSARTPRTAAGSSGGSTMIGGLSFRCAASTGMTTREAWRSALLYLGLTFVLALLHVQLKRTFGPSLWVDALGQLALWGPLMGWTVQLGAGKRTLATRVVLFFILLALMLLSSYAAARWL